MIIRSHHHTNTPRSFSAPNPPAQAAPEPDDTVQLGGLLKKTGRFALGVAGGVAGTALGALAGLPLGASMGAIMGWNGGATLATETLQPLSNVAGIAGQYVNRKLGGGTAASIAGAMVGTATGGVIGVLGTAFAGADAGARQGLRLADALLGPAEPRPRDDSRPTYEQGWGKQIPEPDGVIREDQHHFLYNGAALDTLAHLATSDPEMAAIHRLFESDADYEKQFQMGGWNLDSYLGSPFPGVSPATFHHFAEPFWPGFKAAGWQSRQCYDKAADCWKAGDRKAAVYYLGAAVHIAQDVSLPQHAVPQVSFIGKMVGHQMMENWAESQFDRLKPAPEEGARTIDASTPEEFVDKVATEAAAEYGAAVKDAFRYTAHRQEKARQGLPTDHASQTDFESDPYRNTMRRAVQITPDFLRMFFRDMAAQGYPLEPAAQT